MQRNTRFLFKDVNWNRKPTPSKSPNYPPRSCRPEGPFSLEELCTLCHSLEIPSPELGGQPREGDGGKYSYFLKSSVEGGLTEKLYKTSSFQILPLLHPLARFLQASFSSIHTDGASYRIQPLSSCYTTAWSPMASLSSPA